MNQDHRYKAIHADKGSPSRRVFWDTEHREPDVNSRPMSSEERLLAYAMIKSIQDYKGVSTDGNEECVECHSTEHPACFHEYTRKGESYLLRTNKQCRDFHTNTECARRWINSDEPDVGPERTGWTFIGLCELLGIEPTYLRRNLASQASDEYWEDAAKIQSFLGFHSGKEPSPTWEEAPSDTGRAGKEGESD